MPRRNPPPSFEALIDQDIDNIDAFLVYADWLQQQGDPRGEFILLCHEADRRRDNPAIAAARDQTIEDLGGQLLGELHGPWSRGEVELGWRLGFVDRLRIKPGPDAQAILDGLPTQACCRYLRSLDLSDTDIATLPDGLDTLAWIQDLDLPTDMLEEIQALPPMVRLYRLRGSGIPTLLAFNRLRWVDGVLVGPLRLLATCYQIEAEQFSDADFQGIHDGIEFDEERYMVDMRAWSPAVGAALAKIDDDLDLSHRHWMVIAFVRSHFDQYQYSIGVHSLIRGIGKTLGKEWGNAQCFYGLFIQGPSKQANRYAGLPKPTGT